MIRILFILGLVFTGNALADNEVERYRAHFSSLGLPYEELQNCGPGPCAAADDFNGDGIIDWAALYKYTGDKARRDRWYVDLVILYSQSGSSSPAHAVFTHVGKLNGTTGAVSLSVQRAGVLRIPAGEITLQRHAINVISPGRSGPAHFPTFYWHGSGFYAIDKSAD